MPIYTFTAPQVKAAVISELAAWDDLFPFSEEYKESFAKGVLQRLMLERAAFKPKARQPRRVTGQLGGKKGKGYRVSIDASKIKEQMR